MHIAIWPIPGFKRFFFRLKNKKKKSIFTYVILDWSYNYNANNMYQKVAPIELYVKKERRKKKEKKKEGFKEFLLRKAKLRVRLWLPLKVLSLSAPLIL